MASDSLNQVGRYIRKANRKADQALRRTAKKLPIKDRVRDTVSAVYPFTMKVENDGSQTIFMDINFNKPPPLDCYSDCIATSCEAFQLAYGGHSVTLTNPYEPGTISIYSGGEPLSTAQWYEEDPLAGRVYVQVQSTHAEEFIIICYSYIIC